MGFPEYPSLYFDTLVQLSIIIERWLYRYIIRRRICTILRDVHQAKSTEMFFTAPVLDEGGSYSHCHFLTSWTRLVDEVREQHGSLYLTQCGGLLAEFNPLDNEGLRDLARIHPDDDLTTLTLHRLTKALKPACHDALSCLRDYDWEKGEYVAW
jgi:hypothetical protein